MLDILVTIRKVTSKEIVEYPAFCGNITLDPITKELIPKESLKKSYLVEEEAAKFCEILVNIIHLGQQIDR